MAICYRNRQGLCSESCAGNVVLRVSCVGRRASGIGVEARTGIGVAKPSLSLRLGARVGWCQRRFADDA